MIGTVASNGSIMNSHSHQVKDHLPMGIYVVKGGIGNQLSPIVLVNSQYFSRFKVSNQDCQTPIMVVMNLFSPHGWRGVQLKFGLS